MIIFNLKLPQLLILGYFILPNFVFSQNSLIDSVKNELLLGANIDSTLSYLSSSTRSQESNVEDLADLGLNYSSKNQLMDWYVVFLLDQARINKFSKNHSQTIKKGLEAIQVIEENNLSAEQRCKAQYFVATGLEGLGAYPEAIEVRKRQLDWTFTYGKAKRYMRYIRSIGLMYYRIQAYDSSIVYFKMALAHAESKSHRRHKASALNNIGLAYFKQNKLDSAKHYFEMAQPLFEQGGTKDDSLMASLVWGNLSQCYPVKGNEEKIREWLINEINVTKKYKKNKTLPNAYLRLARLFESQKKYEQAIAYIDSAYQLAFIEGDYVRFEKLQLNILQRYVDILEKMNDPVQGLKYVRQYTDLYKTIYGEEATNVLSVSRSSYQISGIERELKLERVLLNQSKRELLKLEEEERYTRLRTGFIVAIGMVLILVALIVIFKMRSGQKKRRIVEVHSKQLLEASIENKTQMLTQTMLNLTRKKEFSEELMIRFKNEARIDPEFISSIQMFIANEINMDETLLGMDKYMSKLNKEFFTKLKLQFPQLSKNDIKLCGLIRMDLSNKELAIIMNITSESMKSRKTRMSRKMNLSPGTIMYEFLKEI